MVRRAEGWAVTTLHGLGAKSRRPAPIYPRAKIINIGVVMKKNNKSNNVSPIQKAATKEKNRLKKVLINANVSERRMKILEPVILNVAWMKAELDDARGAVGDQPIVVEYDNGGGQSGTRENPLFKAYESLWKSYMTGMSKIIDSLPEEVAAEEIEEAEKPKTVLELVRSKHEKEA